MASHLATHSAVTSPSKVRAGRIEEVAGSLSPAGESLREQQLKDAFEQFNDMSRQLMDSYRMLEDRVTELNSELNSVTDQRMRELAEKEQLANRLESLINFLPAGVVVIDSSGRISDCNPAALELLGEPLKGELWREVIGRSFEPRQDDGHEVSLKDGRRIGIATRNLGSDGQIVLLTDQTETRRLQSELSRHERLSALGRMMSALAHQIRTPLSTAMLYAGHLRGGNLDAQRQQEFSEKLFSRLAHMESQVQDMLLFVKGELPLTDTISVAQLEESLREALEMPLLTAGAHCDWRNDCREQYLTCNREALVGALVNLVNNAIQAVDENAEIRIRFALVEDQTLSISVCDRGPGIDPALLPTVGDLFVTTRSQGTGLGLAVVHAVARAHSGKFQLTSTPGEGACGALLLPLAQ